jgi:hypothetical protein
MFSSDLGPQGILTAKAWLAFLMERQPHKRIELMHRRSQLDSSRKSREQAINRLEEIALMYPQDYLVFQTKQRLLGK